MRRPAHVLCLWRDQERVVQSARHTRGVAASSLVLAVLDRVGEWTATDVLSDHLDLPPAALDVLLDGLQAHDLIEVLDAEPIGNAPARVGAEPTSEPPETSAWPEWAPAARLFHLATRDVTFARRTVSVETTGTCRPSPVLPERSTSRVPLPPPRLDAALAQALHARRTHRRFADAPLSIQDIGTLLGVTFGVQAWAHAAEGPLALKTSPSGGARHSLEAYVWARRVTGVPEGLHHYLPDVHALSALHGHTAPSRVTSWLPAQDGYERASVVIVLASVLARVAWRYHSARAYRVVLIEAGHLAQTFCLAATALGLAPFCTAALADSTIERDLGLDENTQPVTYVIGAGQVAPGPWQPHADRPAPRIEHTDLGRSW